MSSRPQPDDLCSQCGIPVPQHLRGLRCPYCGAEFTRSDSQPSSTGYLTPFGFGMCGVLIGGLLGATLALCSESLRLGDPRFLLFPAAGACTCALMTVWVGARLDAGARRGYEVLLFSLAVAGFGVLTLALAGVTSLETLGVAGVCALLAAVPAVSRFAYKAAPQP